MPLLRCFGELMPPLSPRWPEWLRGQTQGLFSRFGVCQGWVLAVSYGQARNSELHWRDGQGPVVWVPALPRVGLRLSLPSQPRLLHFPKDIF